MRSKFPNPNSIEIIQIYRSLGKVWREKNIRWMPGMTKFNYMKIFLPQRNRAVYSGLLPAKMKNFKFYHGFFLMNIYNR